MQRFAVNDSLIDIYIYIYSQQSRFCGWDDTRKALKKRYFPYGSFKIKYCI